MIDQIYREIIAQRNEDPMVFFKLDSGKMLELVRRSALEFHRPSNSFTPLSDAVKRRIKREDVAAAPLEENYMFALAKGNYRGVNQVIAVTAGCGLADVVNAYSVHYFRGTRLGYWLDYKGVGSSKEQSEYEWQEHEENTSLLNWFVNDFVGDSHKKSFKEIFFTKENLYKILKMIAVQKALRS
ncbi:MAG: hypothetical protein AABZ92_06295 [Verrucomicrobiota bacterium]